MKPKTKHTPGPMIHPKQQTWYHWVMERCPRSMYDNPQCYCTINFSQRPIGEPAGEDLKLNEALTEYKRNQYDGETDYRCTNCDSKLILVSRHAIADCNVIENEAGESWITPLVEGQIRGCYLKENGEPI